MKRGLILFAVLLAGIQLMAFAAVEDTDVPVSIRNNRYFVESLRLANLAQLAYDEGDYDASSQYSEEAIRYAGLSDDYVRLRLKIRETDNAIAAARSRLDYADLLNAAVRYPVEYGLAQTAYGEARSFRLVESWDDAIAAANRVLAALAYIEEEEADGSDGALPSQYTVRTWSEFRDCLWNIAGRSWVYNDPFKWKVLYEANRSKMPEDGNPDLIHPGMILDIPSLNAESRRGMWDADTDYSSFE